MHTASPIPVIATSRLYEDYLAAARTNLENLLRLTRALKDAEFEREARCIIESFDDAAIDALALIDDANANEACAWPEDHFWRESIHAERAGMGQ